MGRYTQPALDLLCQQIARDNPQFAASITSSNIVVLGGPYTTNLGTSGRNTRIVLNGKAGGGIVQKKEFFYDRLDIGKLFNGIPVVYESSADVITVGDLLAPINKQWGINLTASDITNASTTLGTGSDYTTVPMTIASTSLNFTGTLNVSWKRKASGYYPNSGPGNKTLLIGNATEGYFGTVTAAEMFSATEFFLEYFHDKTSLTALPSTGSFYWLKFALDGQFVFFPAGTLLTGMTWNTLSDRGAITGNSSDLILHTKSGVNWYFQPRLPIFSTTDPAANVRGDATSDASRLFNKIHKQTYGTGLWDSLTTLDLTNQFIWKNVVSGASTVFYSQMNQSTLGTIDKAVSGNWRPVLVLVDKTKAVSCPRGVFGDQAAPKPIEIAINPARDTALPYRVTDVNGTIYRSFREIPITDTTITPQLPPKPVVFTETLYAIPFTATITTKTDLALTNGELLGF